MAELLFEILSEEIPARMQANAAADLEKLVCDGLEGAGLSFDVARSYATPRRLCLTIDGLPDRQPDVTEEKKGPKVGAPDKAVEGFLKGNGLSSIDEAEVRELDGKGEFYFAVKHIEGRPTAEVVKGLIEDALTRFPWPKSQRWGTGRTRWVRPAHSMVCLLGGTVVPVEFAGLTASDVTHGHRFLAPDPIQVSDFADYAARLLQAKVMLDGAERANLIKVEAEGLAEKHGLTLKADHGLLHEVAGLVEWPVVLMGSIDDAFMDVPPECLITAMRAHQKYFSCLNADGSLAPRFIMVSNMEAADGGANVVAGNERVLRARLSDAKFFWDQDRKKPLDTFNAKLGEIIFHAKLGTVAEKVERIEGLAAWLAKHIDGADSAMAARAGHLCKADLVSEMVYEFPELQGLMGRYYALEGGEKPEVAEAIAAHYQPAGPSDDCPRAPNSVAVALADKLDTLAGFWLIDEKPTGSKDPFALRRAALGVIRLVLENGLRLPLKQAFAVAFDGYAKTRRDGAGQKADDLMDFFADRLKVHLRDQGVKHDHVAAVFALTGEDDLVRLLLRVDALAKFLATDDGANLLVAYRRAANIVKIEQAKDKTTYDQSIDGAALAEPEEKALAEALAAIGPEVRDALDHEKFEKAMSSLARLRNPVDAFFDKVMVNVEDAGLRANRLRMLSAIGSTMHEIAEFSKIEG